MNQATHEIESMYMTTARRSTYLVGEDWDFGWSLMDVLAVERLWRQGVSLPDIAAQMGRSSTEVFLLLLDRAEHGHIDGRQAGVWGEKLRMEG